MSPPAGELSAARRARLGRRALWLAYTTVGYNLIEAAVALIAGVAASSAALIGFGGDSLIARPGVLRPADPGCRVGEPVVGRRPEQRRDHIDKTWSWGQAVEVLQRAPRYGGAVATATPR